MAAAPRAALVVVDVQNDFCEGGSLAVTGGAAVARDVTAYLRAHRTEYVVVVASRDWHVPHSDNGGHFAAGGHDPDYLTTWPTHCVQGTNGADYHPALDVALIDHHVWKGQGRPAYSAFEGVTATGVRLADVLAAEDVEAVDVVGIATDYCCRATAQDALQAGMIVRVLADLQAGVAPATTAAALADLAVAGATVVRTR